MIRQTLQGHWIIDGDQIGKWVEETGKLNHDGTIDRLLEFIPVGGVVVDAGSNIGTHTISYAQKVGVNGRVLAFEPNPEAMRCLRLNALEYPNICPLRFALSDTQEDLKLIVDDAHNLGASRIGQSGTQETSSLVLDKWFEAIEPMGRFDFFKLDVEGYEVKALMGTNKLIEKYHPVIYCEVNQPLLEMNGTSAVELTALLRDWGYKLNNFDYTRPDDFTLPQFDIICIPK